MTHRLDLAAVPAEALPPLTDELVRATIDRTSDDRGRHQRGRRRLRELAPRACRSGRGLSRRPRIPALVLVEAFSVLTRLPPPHRAPAAIVTAFLRERFREAPFSLPARRYAGLLQSVTAAGIGGGAIYDALIALTVRQAGAVLLTRDVSAGAVYDRLNVRHEFVLVSCARRLGTSSGRGIPAGGVAPPSNTPGILGRRALPAGRRAPEAVYRSVVRRTLGSPTRRADPAPCVADRCPSVARAGDAGGPRGVRVG